MRHAVVVAHLHGALKSAAAACPVGPIKASLEFWHRVVRAIPEERAIIHLGGVHDLARVEQAIGVKALFHLCEICNHPRAEHLLVKLRADQPVAMFARMGPFVARNQVKAFFCNRPHLLDVLIELEVQNRAHMQTANRRMRIPSAARAVLFENLSQTSGIVGEVRQLNGAVLDK